MDEICILKNPVLTPGEQAGGEQVYPSEAEEFRLSGLNVEAGMKYTSPEIRSVEIMICTRGRALVKDLAREKTLEIDRGVSILVPAAVHRYCIRGDATFYRASVP